MKKTLLIASSALALVLSGSILAGGSDHMASAAAPSVAAPTQSNGSGFYVGAEGGVALMSGKVGEDKASDVFNTGFDLGGHVGYAFGNGFRAEAAVGYIRHNVKDPDPKGYLNMWTFMANGYYDFNLGGGFTPFVGVGLGMAHPSLSAILDGMTVTVSDNNHFAYQGIVGVAYKINQNFSANVNYHLMKITGKDRFGSSVRLLEEGNYLSKALYHSINVGVNYSF